MKQQAACIAECIFSTLAQDLVLRFFLAPQTLFPWTNKITIPLNTTVTQSIAFFSKLSSQLISDPLIAAYFFKLYVNNRTIEHSVTRQHLHRLRTTRRDSKSKAATNTHQHVSDANKIARYTRTLTGYKRYCLVGRFHGVARKFAPDIIACTARFRLLPK